MNKMAIVSAVVGLKGQRDKQALGIQYEEGSDRGGHPSTQPRLLGNTQNTAEKEISPLQRPLEVVRIINK